MKNGPVPQRAVRARIVDEGVAHAKRAHFVVVTNRVASRAGGGVG